MNDTVINVTLPAKLKADAQAKCREKGVSLSHIVREALKFWVDDRLDYGISAKEA